MVKIRKTAKGSRISLKGFAKENAEYKIVKVDKVIILNPKPSTGARSHRRGIGKEQFQRIVAALEKQPLTYNELLDAVPEFKSYSRPLNSLRPVILRYGMIPGKGIIEYTNDRPLKLRLKNYHYAFRRQKQTNK